MKPVGIPGTFGLKAEEGVSHEEIEQLLTTIATQQEAIMAAIDDLNTAVANLQAQATATEAYLATVPAQIAAGVASAEAALNTSVETATAAINAVVTAQAAAIAAAPAEAPAQAAPPAAVSTDS